MIGSRRRFLRGATAGLVLAVLTGCANLSGIEEPRVWLSDLKLLDGTMFEQHMQIDLRVVNPNDIDLEIEGMTFNLELNDRPFATGVSNQHVTVPRLGETIVSIRATTTLLDTIKQFLALQESRDLSYRMSGVAHVRGFAGRGLPYERSGSLSMAPGGRSLLPPRTKPFGT